jgi:membrane-associated phospholipid phosphatase
VRKSFPSRLSLLFAAVIAAPFFGEAAKACQAVETSGPSSQVKQAAREATREATQGYSTLTANGWFSRLVKDQKTIFASPLRIKRRDAKWLLPLAGATTALILTDKRSAGMVSGPQSLKGPSDVVSSLGSPYALFGAAGATYAIGNIAGDGRLTRAGALGLEALVDTAILTRSLKLAFGRGRPTARASQGRFRAGGESFPSGHSMTTWALATVFAREYSDRKLVRLGAYGLATAVSISRFTGRDHFPSDVLVGSALGHLIGRWVVGRQEKSEGRAMTNISPYVNRVTRTYGVGIAVSF